MSVVNSGAWMSWRGFHAKNVVCVDDKGLIMREYEKRSGHRGQA